MNQEGRREEGIEMEKLISSAIWQNENAPKRRPVVGFYCYLESVLEGTDTRVRITMENKEGAKDFNTFFQFTKMFLYKMVEKHFS